MTKMEILLLLDEISSDIKAFQAMLASNNYSHLAEGRLQRAILLFKKQEKELDDQLSVFLNSEYNPDDMTSTITCF